MDITKKLKEHLSEEDLKEFESAVKKLVSDQVTLKVEEKTIALENKAEVFCEQEIAKKVEEEKEVIIEEYEKKMEELETNLVEKLDKFLESEINEQISDEVISKIAINETFEPIIEGIKKLYENEYVALDVEGSGLIAKSKKDVEQLKEDNSKLISEKMELSELVEKGALKLIISEKTDGLTETQKKRVNVFCEGKAFSEVESKIDSFIEIVEEKEEVINESNEPSEEVNLDENQKNESNEDGIDESEINKDEKSDVEDILEETDFDTEITSAQRYL